MKSYVAICVYFFNIDPPSDMVVDYALEFLVSGTLAIVKHWYDMGKSMPIEKLMPMMHKLMANQFVEDFRLSAKKD